MKRIIKYCVLLLVAILLFNCSNYERYIKAHQLMNVDFERTYRDYVLCKCLEFGYNEPEIFANDISRAVYEDISLYTISSSETKKKLDSLGKSAGESILPSQIADYEGKKAVLLHCIEFYNSEKLQVEVRKIIKANAKLWAERPST